MREYLNTLWEIIGMVTVVVAAYLLFSLMASEKKVSQYELGGSTKGSGGWINVNIDNHLDESVPTFGMTTEEVVNLINDLNESLPNK